MSEQEMPKTVTIANTQQERDDIIAQIALIDASAFMLGWNPEMRYKRNELMKMLKDVDQIKKITKGAQNG